MELGSIHPDERSARRAIAALIDAGIEAQRVRLLRPRTARGIDLEERSSRRWKQAACDIVGGAALALFAGIMVCVLLTVIGGPVLESDPLGAYAWVLGTSAAAGASSGILVHLRYREIMSLTQPRPRRTVRGWAVVVHARDAEQRALAARALARLPRGVVAA